MVKYRRYHVSGGIYFFTAVLQDRQSDWLVRYIQQLTSAMKRAQQIMPHKVIALVVLPDHLHVIWSLPENDSDYSARWRFIKTQFARNVRKLGVSIPKNRFGENVLWQRRFWEHVIRDDKDYEKHVDYIHYNPVKHQLVEQPNDWPYSTFRKYVKRGLLPADWCYKNEDINVE